LRLLSHPIQYPGIVSSTRLLFALLLLLCFKNGIVSLGAEGSSLKLRVVPTPIKSYRLLSMTMDEDGFIWCGSIHRVVQWPAASGAASCARSRRSMTNPMR
jgi:hypothetical protein